MRWQAASLCTLAIGACIGFFYLIPTLIEKQLVSHAGPFWAVLVLGDLAGCLAIAAAWRLKYGAALYLCLTGAEIVLFQTGAVSAAALLWLTDAAPTLILCALAAKTLAFIFSENHSDQPELRG
jgi:hypothetical protein